jgi:methyl-accepting chemotaxis protein
MAGNELTLNMSLDPKQVLDSVGKIKTGIENFYKEFGKDNTKAQEHLKNLSKEITNFDDSFKKSGETSDEFFKEIIEHLNKVNESSKGVGDILNGWGSAFARISVLKESISGIGNFIGGLIEGPKQMEKAMAQLTFVSKDAKDNADMIKSSLSAMSRAMPIKDTKELVYAMKDLAADGFNVQDSLKLMEQAARGAVAGNTEVGASVGVLKSIIGAYGLEVEKSAEIQDKLFKASQMTGEGYDNIANSMSGAITNVATLGVSFDNFLGSVTALTKINTPLQESIGLMDMASKQFTDSLGSAYMETHSLTDIMIGVYEKANGEFGKIVDMGMKPELARAILKIGQNANAVKSDLEELGNASGTTEDAFKTSANSIENLMQTIQNNFNSVKGSFANALLPVVSEVLEVFKNVMQWIGNLPAPIKTVISSIGILSTAFVTLKVTGILPLILDFKKLATESMTNVLSGLSKMKVAFLSTTGVTNGLRAAMTALGTAGPMVLFTIAGLLLAYLPQIVNWVKSLMGTAEESGNMFAELKELVVN